MCVCIYIYIYIYICIYICICVCVCVFEWKRYVCEFYSYHKHKSRPSIMLGSYFTFRVGYLCPLKLNAFITRDVTFCVQTR